jgi:hypothetical protein
MVGTITQAAKSITKATIPKITSIAFLLYAVSIYIFIIERLYFTVITSVLRLGYSHVTDMLRGISQANGDKPEKKGQQKASLTRLASGPDGWALVPKWTLSPAA